MVLFYYSRRNSHFRNSPNETCGQERVVYGLLVETLFTWWRFSQKMKRHLSGILVVFHVEFGKQVNLPFHIIPKGNIIELRQTRRGKKLVTAMCLKLCSSTHVSAKCLPCFSDSSFSIYIPCLCVWKKANKVDPFQLSSIGFNFSKTQNFKLFRTMFLSTRIKRLFKISSLHTQKLCPFALSE